MVCVCVCVCVCLCNLVGFFRCFVVLYGCILCRDSACDALRDVVSCCGDVGMVVWYVASRTLVVVRLG